ncbi:rho guanine nucleotide exchange factor 3 isoform X2 [Amblyomma americanum]
MSSSAQAVDQATLDSIARNRNRLLRLADNIKVRKKPGSKRAVDLRLDPGYTNIEHLVFGTYRPRTSLPGSSQLPAAGPDEPQQPPLQQPPAPAQPAAHSSREATAALLSTPPPTRCECSAHSPRRRVPPCGGSEQQGEVAGVSDDAGGRACPADQRASRTERPPPAPAAGHAWPSGSSTHDATVVTAALACDEPAAAHARGDMSRVAASCFDAGGVAGRRSSKRVARSGSLQTRTTTTQGRQEFEKTSSYAPGLGGEEARIIQVDLHAASRPKVREPAVVYSLQPAVDFAGHELRVVSASGASQPSAIPKPRTRKAPVGSGQVEDVRSHVVVDARARRAAPQPQQHPIVIAPTTRRQPPPRSHSINARDVHIQPSSFRKAASVSEKMPVKPVTIPVIRNSSIHRWSTGTKASQMTLPRTRPRAAEERVKPAKNCVKFAEPLQECCNTVPSSSSGRVPAVLLNGTKATDGRVTCGANGPGRDPSLSAVPAALPPCCKPPALPPKTAQESVNEMVPKPRQPTSRRPMPPPCQNANLTEERARLLNGSSPAKLPSTACTFSPKPVPRKDVRPADVLPLSPWRGVQPKPQPVSDHSVDALLLADTCISPPGMFKDRDITDQSSYKPPPLTESTLSRWVGNTSRESARLLNELAMFAESKLPCRLNEPQSRSGLAIGAAETWFDSLRKDTCEEPTALQSPVRESTSHLLPSASGAASSSRTASRSDCPTGSPSISRASNGKVLVTMRSHSVEDAADDVADDVRASPRVRKTSSVEVPGVARDPSAAPSGSPAPYHSPKLVNGSGLTASPAHSQHQQQYVHHGSPQLQREHRPPPPPPPPPLQPVGFSPTRSPYRKKSTGQQPVAMPPKVWMSDIEERDENSSSSAASKVAADLRGDPDCTLLHSSSSSSASSSSTISESNGVSVVVRVSSWDQRSSSAPTLSTIGPLSPGRPPLSFESHSFAVNGGVTNGYWMPKTFAQCNGASGCEPLLHPKDLSGAIPESCAPSSDDVPAAAELRSPPPPMGRRASADGAACSPLTSPSARPAPPPPPSPPAQSDAESIHGARSSPPPLPSAPAPSASKCLLLGRPGKLIRDRPISRSERHLKAASTPEFHSGSTEDVCCRNVRRPWSQLYSDAEAEQLFAAVGSMSNLQQQPHQRQSSSPPDGVHPGLPPRYSSLRASSPRLIADSVLQKFRKTFSLRFQRNRKGSTTSLPAVSAPCSSVAAAEAPAHLLLANGGGSDEEGGWPPCAPAGEDEEEGGFRPGPTILRSSRERRLHRKNRELRGSKCSSADSGIQLEAPGGQGADQSEADSTDDSSQTSIQRKAESISAVITINGVTCSGRQGSYSSLSQARAEAESVVCDDNQLPSSPHSSSHVPPHAHKAPSFDRQFSTPPPIKTRIERSRPTIRRQKGRGALRRSISQPLDLEKSDKNDLAQKEQLSHGLSDQEASRNPSTASSEEDFSSDGESYSQIPKDYEGVTYVEALWDHVTLDSEELAFQAGEVIEVTDMSDKDWWWGSVDQRHGWFPAAFVRLRVGQEDTVEDCITKMADGTLTQHKPRKMSIGLLSNEEVRAKVVMEIVNTERDFVRHLKDVVQGYLAQVRRRPDMFSEERRATIFGNIEQLYEFQNGFLKHLESAVDWEQPHLSQIGRVFLKHRQEFKIYSEYCNNHPLAVSELQEVYADSKYVHFFEACRLLQDMIDISLDGFLLTPVQKICKYPLQLAELLKYTRPDHADYHAVREALAAMKGVAQMVNERKRRMECLEKLAEWQNSVFNWEGPDLLDTSSMLVHSGEAVRVSSVWSRDVVSLFLFDNLLVYCKKDMIKRNTLSYKGRLNMNSCCVVDVENGKDSQFGTTVRNAWKIYCTTREKWYLFYTKTAAEKEKWLQAFHAERKRVRDDREQGYVVTESAKKSAKMALHNKLKPKRPRAKLPKGPRSQHPDVAVVEILLDPPGPKPRTGSLPSTLHTSHHTVSANGLPKKKGSGWFHFGSGKKVKK